MSLIDFIEKSFILVLGIVIGGHLRLDIAILKGAHAPLLFLAGVCASLIGRKILLEGRPRPDERFFGDMSHWVHGSREKGLGFLVLGILAIIGALISL